MKNLKLIPGTLCIILLTFVSCDTSNEPVKDVKGILTAKPWYFLSINGGEGYPCVQQTNMTFHTNGKLEIKGYVREPDYTCSGPHLFNYEYELLENNTKVQFDGQVFSIAKLTDNEFIKTAIRDGKENEWVYRRYD